MAKQKQDDQFEHTYSSYVMIRDVAQKTCQKRRIIGRSGERGAGISMMAARHDDDDDDIWHMKRTRITRQLDQTADAVRTSNNSLFTLARTYSLCRYNQRLDYLLF